MKTSPACFPVCSCSALSRRGFLAAAAGAALASIPVLRGQDAPPARKVGSTGGASLPNDVKHRPVIDIHAHQLPDSMLGKGGGRTEAEFLAHQAALNAVGAVILGGNDYEYGFIRKDPNRNVRFANGGPGAGDRVTSIAKALKNGARGIGELRYEGFVPSTTQVIELARDFDVPIQDFPLQRPKAVEAESRVILFATPASGAQ